MVYKKRLCTTTIAVNAGKRDKLCEKADFIDVLFAEPPEQLSASHHLHHAASFG